ncbi:hypothetical protein WDU94_002583 [Cyamophila willieti]
MTSNEVKKTLQLINNINQNSNVELKIQSLAKIKSNLTNNENLKIFKQLCGFKHLCGLLKNNANVKVVNLVLSILANSAMNEEVRREIVVEHHVLQYVFSTLEYIENPAIHCRAIRLVANVSRTSVYSKYVMRFPFLPKIVGVLKSTSSSDSIITCIRAIKYLWLWDQYRIQNELMSLNTIKHILDKLTLLSDKPALILSHLQMIQIMLNVNTKAFISQMSFLHYEWMVNLLRQENGQYDSVLVQILLKLSAYSKTHFEIAKTSLLERIISLIWPPNTCRNTHQTYLLIRIIASLCKENLFRQKVIQTPYAIQALLTYLDMDNVENDTGEMRDADDAQSSFATRSSKPDQSSSGASNLTNSIHYYILMAINPYQYDHEGLYRFLRANLIPILMKRLEGQIEKYEYKHTSPVCDQSKYLSSKQTLNASGNMSPLSPNYSSGNFSPTNSSSPPRYMSPVNPWSPLWNASTSTAPGFDVGFDPTNEDEEEMKNEDDDDDDKSVYSPLIEFSDDDTTLSNQGDDDNQTDAASSILGSTDSQEERLDVHIIRIMLHISYMKYLFDHLSLKQTWSTLIEYLVKVQQDDCCRNVYKILLIICKNRAFLRSLLVDNFILHVHKKLVRTKHGTHCMICNNVMIYGQGIINEISNETNSHYGYEEIMIQYRHQDQQKQHQEQMHMQLQHQQIHDHHHQQQQILLQQQFGDPNLNPPDPENPILPSNNHPSNIPHPKTDLNLSSNPVIPSAHPNPIPPTADSNLIASPTISTANPNPIPPTNESNPVPSSHLPSNTPPTSDPISTNLIHFMIPYLLKDHPSFNRLLFGSDAILFRILSELEGPNQEEAVACVEELLSGVTMPSVRGSTIGSRFCRGKCAPGLVTYEGDLTFLLDDGSTLVTNRQLLIHKSLYFETMLCGNFKECDQKSAIKLSRISSACLSHLLKLIGSDSCTCALPRTNGPNVLIYLELIIKSDEYLLHELNYRLIQLLYGSSEVVNPSNVHLVYEWSLRYNEFVQTCLSNYENYFSKSNYESAPASRSSSDWSPSLTQGVKRVKLSDKCERNNEESEGYQRANLSVRSEETESIKDTTGLSRYETNDGVKRNPDSEMKEENKIEQEKTNESKEDEREMRFRTGNKSMEESDGKQKTKLNKMAVIVDKTTIVASSSCDSTHVTFCDKQETSDGTQDKTNDAFNQNDDGKSSDSIYNKNDGEKRSHETIVNKEPSQKNSNTNSNDSNNSVENNRTDSVENVDLVKRETDKTSHLAQTNPDVKRLETEFMDVQPGCSSDKVVDMKESERTKIEMVETSVENIDENNANVTEKEKIDQFNVNENSKDADEAGKEGKQLKHGKKEYERDSVKDDIVCKDEVRENERTDEHLNELEEQKGDNVTKDTVRKEGRQEENPCTVDGKSKEIDKNNIVDEEKNDDIEMDQADNSVEEPQPCLISDLIEEINKNQASLSKVSTTMSPSLQNNRDQGKADQIKNILLLKNEPSFKLRKRVSNCIVSGKRKFGNVAGNKRREDLNIFLVKLVFGYSTSLNYSSGKCVEIVRNIIEMSTTRENKEKSRVGDEMEPEANIFDQFKQDVYDLIEENLR